MGGSTVYFEKTGAKDIRSTRLLDLEEMRLEQMDEYGMDMMIMSLNSPAIQEITDVQQAATIARKSNEDLAAANSITAERMPVRNIAEPTITFFTVEYLPSLSFCRAAAAGSRYGHQGAALRD